MIVTRGRMVVLVGGSLYLLVMAAAGVAVERIRFDRQRTAVLHRHDEAVKQWQKFLMATERRVEAAASAGHSVPVVR